MAEEADQLERIPVPVFEIEPSELPRHCVIDGELVSQTDLGEVRISLRVPFRLIRTLALLTPRAQLYTVLIDRERKPSWWSRLIFWRRRSRTVRTLEDLDYVDSEEIVAKFWQAFAEREQVRLGESLRSSAA